MALALVFSISCHRITSAQLEQQAQQEILQGQYDVALRDADTGLRRFSEPEQQARFANIKAESLLWKGEIKQIETIATTRLNASYSLDARTKRNYIAFMYGYYKSNAELARQAMDELNALAPSSALAATYAKLCIGMASVSKDPATAEKWFRQAYASAQQEHLNLESMIALGNLQNADIRQRRYDQAVDDCQQMITLSQMIGNASFEIRSKGNLSVAYTELGDYDMAESLAQENLRAAEHLGLIKDQSFSLNSLGVVAMHNERYAEAMQYYERAYQLANKQGNVQTTALPLSNIAMAAVEANQIDTAERYLKQAIELNKKVGDPTVRTGLLETAAMIESRRGHGEQAIAMLKQALADANSHDVYRDWEFQTLMGESYTRMGRPKEAVAAYAAALKASDANRLRVKSQQNRISFLGRSEWLYDDYIGELASQNKSREALALAEHSRSLSLEEGLQNFTAKLPTFAPEQAARRNNAVILEYWESSTQGYKQTYLWFVTAKGTELIKLPPPEQIDPLIRSYRKAVTGPLDPLSTGNAEGRKLFDLLVAPVADRIPANGRVILVTGGALSGLNFETLIRTTPQPHYWIEDVTIVNATAISYLPASTPRATLKGRRLLMMGDALPSTKEYPPLRHAGEEMTRVEKHFPAADRTTLRGAQARPSVYSASHVGEYGYLHFVTHGTASTTAPLESSIILSPENGGDYKLHAQTILNQKLKANLVTISACYGAGVRSYVGEGLVGLSWAFMRAGAHNVIASMWEVNDASTPILMDELYGALERTGDAAESLRAAKLALLHSRSVYRKPFYWAAFQLYSGS